MSKVNIFDEAVDLYEKKLDDILKEQPVSPDYFEFRYSSEKDIGRTFPQVENIFFAPEINSPAMYDLSLFPKPGDFNGKVELKKSAKLTDFLSSWQSGKGIMVSSNCHDIFKFYNLGHHMSYQFKCSFKDSEWNYVFLVVDNPLVDFIDYPNSIFYTSNLFDDHLHDIIFSSKSEFLSYKNELEKDKYNRAGYSEGLIPNDVQLKKVVVKSEFQNFDIFTWRATHYLSRKLVTQLRANNMTGMIIKETRRIFKA